MSHRALMRVLVTCAVLAVLTSGDVHTQARSPATDDIRHFKGGKVIALAAGREPTAPAVAEAVAAEFAADLPSPVRVWREAAPVVARSSDTLVYRFRLEVETIPLSAESDLVAVIGRGGRLLSSRIRNVPATIDPLVPTVAATEAIGAALAHAAAAGVPRADVRPSVPYLEIWVDAAHHGRLTWRIDVAGATSERPLALAYRIAAVGAPHVVSVRDTIQWQSRAHVQSDVWSPAPPAPDQGVALAPVPFVDLTANGLAGFSTDAAGDVSLPSGPAAVTLQLNGRYADVRPASGPRLVRTFVTSGGADVLSLNPATPSEVAQVTAFLWVTRTNHWARTFLPFLDASPTLLDEIAVTTGSPGGCNAFFGEAVGIGFQATSTCNAATPTIVAHEFGHALHSTLSQGLLEPALTEGLADAIAGLVTGQTCLSATSGPCVRDLTEVSPYPVDSPDPHHRGKPYAQFMWALSEDVGVHTASSLMLAAAAAAPVDIPDAVRWSFIVDDTDGDLATCSPHQVSLQVAADSRSLPRPPDCGVGTTLTAVTPVGPANHNAPVFSGTTGPNLPVGLFTHDQCLGAPSVSGVSDATGAFSLMMTVPDDSVTTVFARALPVDGRTGACSRGLTYVEDSTAPVVPMLSGTTPASPASSTQPVLLGQAPGARQVRVFGRACGGSPLAVVPVAAGAFAAPVVVSPLASTSLVADAVDDAGNVSKCSAPLVYTHVPPSLTISDASAFEGKSGAVTNLSFTVSLTAPISTSVSVLATTADVTATGTDYRAASIRLMFAPGETSKTVIIAMLGDGVVERDETFEVRLSATGAPLLRQAGIGTIRNDDNVGVATLAPVHAVAETRQAMPLSFGWVVPAAKPDGTATNNSWRDLTAMTLRLVTERGEVAFEVEWLQASNTFRVKGQSGRWRAPFSPGASAGPQQTSWVSLDPALTIVQTAPGPAVTVVLPLTFKQRAVGEVLVVEGAAVDDYGDEQPFERLGTVRVRR